MTNFEKQFVSVLKSMTRIDLNNKVLLSKTRNFIVLYPLSLVECIHGSYDENVITVHKAGINRYQYETALQNAFPEHTIIVI